MVAWWLLPVALIAGTCIGFVLMGICAADRDRRRDDE